MKEKGWSHRTKKRKLVTTTDSDHEFQVYQNLVQDPDIKPSIGFC